MSDLRLGLAALALAATVGAASAQTASPSTQTAPADQPAATQQSTDKQEKPPFAGANSFTEAQARDRIASAGYSDVKDLKKDDNGIWRGIAKKGDTQVNVALDFRGNVVQE
jgi:hypothetical protein